MVANPISRLASALDLEETLHLMNIPSARRTALKCGWGEGVIIGDLVAPRCGEGRVENTTDNLPVVLWGKAPPRGVVYPFGGAGLVGDSVVMGGCCRRHGEG